MNEINEQRKLIIKINYIEKKKENFKASLLNLTTWQELQYLHFSHVILVISYFVGVLLGDL